MLIPSIKKVPCDDKRATWVKGAGIYFGKIHRFRKLVMNIFLTQKPDIVIYDTSIVSYQLIRAAKKLGIFVITIHHNVERDYLQDNPRPLVYRIAYRYHLFKAERDAVKISNLNLTLTDSDRKRLTLLYEPENEIATSGVFEPLCLPESVVPSQVAGASGHPKFVITGNLSFPQTDLSVRLFISTYWPIARKCRSDSELIITGKDPSRQLKSLSRKFKDIRLIPNPQNISGIVAECNYYICPVDKEADLN